MAFNIIKKQIQRMRQLELRDDFRADILKLRKKWDIKKDGFSPDEYNQWKERLFQKSDDYFDDPEIIKQNNQAHDEENPISRNQKLQKIKSDDPAEDFYNDIENLIKKYNLPFNYHENLEYYILTNKIDPNRFSGTKVIPCWEYDNFFKKRIIKNLHIEVTADTTKKDIDRAYQFIKYLKKEGRLFGGTGKKRTKELKQLTRDEEIYGLHMKGLSNKEILQITNKKYKPFLGETDIPPIIKRFRDNYKNNL